MKKVRIYTNLLLGSCIAFLVGCGAQKKAAKSQAANEGPAQTETSVEQGKDASAQPSESQPAQESKEEKIEDVRRGQGTICLYGIPPEIYKKLQEQDSIQ
ncbi:MAG: hypothetical protein MJZ82_03160 [Paludibacteraceae bacterium]|nr:hypothetical protein [Paludibacteraceae bacterium]